VKAAQVPSRGGVFDVEVNGKLIWSKKQTGRHIRNNEEILDLLRKMRAR